MVATWPITAFRSAAVSWVGRVCRWCIETSELTIVYAGIVHVTPKCKGFFLHSGGRRPHNFSANFNLSPLFVEVVRTSQRIAETVGQNKHLAKVRVFRWWRTWDLCVRIPREAVVVFDFSPLSEPTTINTTNQCESCSIVIRGGASADIISSWWVFFCAFYLFCCIVYVAIT